eukprot:16402_6
MQVTASFHVYCAHKCNFVSFRKDGYSRTTPQNSADLRKGESHTSRITHSCRKELGHIKATKCCKGRYSCEGGTTVHADVLS